MKIIYSNTQVKDKGWSSPKLLNLGKVSYLVKTLKCTHFRGNLGHPPCTYKERLQEKDDICLAYCSGTHDHPEQIQNTAVNL